MPGSGTAVVARFTETGVQGDPESGIRKCLELECRCRRVCGEILRKKLISYV